jgi:2-hydroxychromene-2-carboxylate isomerase
VVLGLRRSSRSSGGFPVPDELGAFFAFDLASVETYLVADRVLKGVPKDVSWLPAAAELLGPEACGDYDARRDVAEARAQALGLPLVWPQAHPGAVPRAMRAATHAASVGVGGLFMRVCARLRFAAGFDLEGHALDSISIAGVRRSALRGLAAAVDEESRDAEVQLTTERLAGEGVKRLPALRLNGRVACGEASIHDLFNRHE